MNGPDIVSRERWAARAPAGVIRPMSRYEGFVVHHTAGPQPLGADAGSAAVLAIQRLHQDQRGWADIGYNYLIDGGGRIYLGRPLVDGELARGAHAPPVNSTHVGISLLGCFHPAEPGCTAVPQDEQIDALVALCRHLMVRYWMRSPELTGHRDHRATACPGDLLFGRLDEIRGRIAGQHTLTLDRPTAGA